MSILEDVLLNAKSAVDTVGKKAGKVIDASKLTIAAADIKAEISKKYEILGRIVYEAKTTGKCYDKSIEEIVTKINELKAQLASVNEMIASGKKQQKCPACGYYNPKNALYCCKCGTRLPAPAADEEEISPDDVIDFTEDNFTDDDMGI